MSTILNALKRLDEQRRSDASPRTLEEQVLLGASARTASGHARGGLWRWIAGGCAMALLAAGGGWLALREAPAREEPVPLAAAAPAAVQPEPTLAPLRPAADPAPTAAETAARPASAAAAPSLPAPVPEPEPAPLATGVAPAREAPIRSVAEPPPVAVARAPREPSAPPREAAPTPPEPREAAPAPDAQAAPPAAPPETSPASLASEDAAAASPEPAPAVRVERTLWHPAPEKRSALVRVAASGEQRELREGDAVDGLVVQEIRPSGVTFLRDGREWRRGVGEE